MTSRDLVIFALSALVTTGCGGTVPAGGTTPTGKPAKLAPDVVGKSKLPFRVLRGDGGQEITSEAFYTELATAQAVCLGENHSSPHDHWAQLEVIDKLSLAAKGAVLALGMEMFQRPFQGVLDDYTAGRIDEAALLSRTGWEERWGYDFALYRPMVALAIERGMSLVALNAERELVKKVSKNGPDGLGDADRTKLPELELADPEHKAWWDAIMASMGGAHGHGGNNPHHTSDEMKERAFRMYAVQVLWDEAMADTAARWLAAGADRKIIILAGNGHCHTSAIVRRIKRRGAPAVVSVRPIVDDGKGNVARELASPIHDFLFVMENPE